MKIKPLDWPAFEGASLGPDQLVCERGVLGKAPGATTDYRWLGASAGFPCGRQIVERINVGVENEPKDSPYLCSTGDWLLAVYISPSEATDAFSRAALDKQILAARDQTNPLRFAALALPRVEELAAEDPAIRWYEYHEQWRTDEQLIRQLDPVKIPISERAIDTTLEKACCELAKELGEECLARFYQGLSPFNQGWLQTQRPLSTAALAALLLPLAPEQGHLSLAGWQPGRIDREKARSWQGIASPSRPPGFLDHGEPTEEARSMARALLARNSSLLPRLGPTPEKKLTYKRPELSATVHLAPFKKLDLQSPGEGTNALLQEIYEFARDPYRRLETADELGVPENPHRRFPSSSSEANSLNFWIRDLRTLRPRFHKTFDGPLAQADEGEWLQKIKTLETIRQRLISQGSR